MDAFSYAPRYTPLKAVLCKITRDDADYYLKEARKAGFTVFTDVKRHVYFVIVCAYSTIFRKDD